MTITVEIVSASLRDLPAVWALEHACFGPDAWSLVDIFFALASPTVRLKAVCGGRLVGFVMGDPHPSRGFAWIATLGVHPDFQRRGIGARLLAATETRLTTPRLKLTVRRSNAAAIALYRKFGYEPVSVLNRYYAKGEAGLLMEKQHRG
ncbi:MAG: GNAT family N-acetyltransferase [Anaerolineales bacterium]|nr:GNAT family N-acetyltransferase [Anaerolineales bacterium]